MYLSLFLSATTILLLLIFITPTTIATTANNITNAQHNMTEIEEENEKLMTIASNPNVSFGETSNDVISADPAPIDSPIPIKPAKLMVSVNKTSDCYSSSDCSKINPRDMRIEVYTFHNNRYSLASDFPGSILGKFVIFDDPTYFRYAPLYVEVIAWPSPLGNNTSISYDSCVINLDQGDFNWCKISLKSKR